MGQEPTTLLAENLFVGNAAGPQLAPVRLVRCQPEVGAQKKFEVAIGPVLNSYSVGLTPK